MKHKWIKIVLTAAAVSLVAGGICLGAGVAMGGSPGFYVDKAGIHVKENASSSREPDYVLEKTATGSLKKLDIDLRDADLILEYGDAWTVEYLLEDYRMEPEYSLENGTLKIHENRNMINRINRSYWFGSDWWGWGETKPAPSPYVRITVPDGARLEEAKLVSSYGDISIEKNLHVSDMVIQSHDGKIRIDGWEGDLLTFDMQYGDIVAGKLDGGDVSVKSHDGSVKIEELCTDTADFDMAYGDLDAVLNGTKSVEAEVMDGSVTLDLIGGTDQYGVSLHSEYGTIRTSQGIVEPDEYGENSDYIKITGESAGVRVYTEYGDIRVRDK